MFLIGLTIILISAIFLLGTALKRLTLSRREWLIFAITAIGGLMFTAASINPPESWDLFRHYELLNQMNSGGLDYILNSSIYSHLPVINLLYGLVSFTGIPQLLPVIVVGICYGILSYMLFDYCRENSVTNARAVAFVIILNLALCPYLHLVSGIRNILAYTICALALYKEFFHNKKILPLILYACAIFIHPASVIIFGIRIIYPIFCKFKPLAFVAIFWSIAADIISKILMALPVKFLYDIGVKLADYTSGRDFSGYKIFIVKMIFLLSLLLVIEYVKKTNQIASETAIYKYMQITQLIIIVALGSFKVMFIADRLCYHLAFLCVPIFIYIYKNLNGKIRHIFNIESIGICMLLFAHQLACFSQF